MPNKKGWNLAPQWLRLGGSANAASEKQLLPPLGNSFNDTQPSSRNIEATPKPQLPEPSVRPQDKFPSNVDLLLQSPSMIREQSQSTHHSNNKTHSSFNTETSMTGDVTNNQPTMIFLGPVNNITVVPGAPLPAGGRNVTDVVENVMAETRTTQAVSSPKLSPMEKAGVFATVSAVAECTPISMANTPAKEPLPAPLNPKSDYNGRRKSWFSLLSSKNGYSVRSNSKLQSEKKITVDDVRYYLPDTTRAHVLGYMSTSLFDIKDTTIIPLYSPSPMLSTEPQAWQQHVCVGDVGCFTEKGGFKTLFNVFKTSDQNINLGYYPPPGFTEYPFQIPHAFQRVDVEKSDDITLSQGFIIEKGANRNQSSTSLLSIHLPKKQPTKCSAIHMMAGYNETYIDYIYLEGLQGYMEENYICWHQLVGEGSHPLMFVHTTFKAKSWAIAVSTKSSRSSKRATADLLEGQRAHFWSSSDNSIIQTSFGPSSDQIKAMNSYLQSPLTSTFSPEQRNNAEECHCVALKAFTIGNKRSGRWGNGSVYGGQGGAASLHAAASWRTAPVQYRSMRIEEEPALPNAP